MVLINLFCSLYTHAHADTVSGTADTGGLSTGMMVALGVGIVTLAVIILVLCCTKNHRNSQLQGKQFFCMVRASWGAVTLLIHKQ